MDLLTNERIIAKINEFRNILNTPIRHALELSPEHRIINKKYFITYNDAVNRSISVDDVNIMHSSIIYFEPCILYV